MMITRTDATCWFLYCHGNSVTLMDLWKSGIPTRMTNECCCNFVAPVYPCKDVQGRDYDAKVIKAVENTYKRLCSDTSCPIYVIGRSIGSGIALNSCSHREPAGIVLISAFESVRKLAPWGLRWFVPNRLDNVSALKDYSGVNKLIIHGQEDDLVPLHHAETLASTTNRAKLSIIPAMTHVPTPTNISRICDEIKTFISKHRNNAIRAHYSLWKAP